MLRTRGADGADFSSGAILVVHKDTQSVEYRGQLVTAKSMIRHVMVDCKAAVYAYTLEFHFAMPRPARTDVPVASFSYNSTAGSFVSVDKSGTIYKTFCAEFV